MRPSFYPTLFQSGTAARYLTENDFPNTTALYGWRAGASGILTTVYGGINLSAALDDGYNTGTDHIGNSVKCLADDDANTASNASLYFTGTEDYSLFIWAKLSDWESSESQNLIYFSSSDGGSGISYCQLGIDNGSLYFLVADSTSGQSIEIYIAHSLTGNGWHSVALTRNVTGTETKIYLDGSLLDTQSVATEYLDFSSAYYFYSHYLDNLPAHTDEIYGTEVWLQKGTIWTPGEVASLHNIGYVA